MRSVGRALRESGWQDTSGSSTSITAWGHRCLPSGPAWDGDEQRRVPMCSMAFKGLAMVVRTDDRDGVPPLILVSADWRQLWAVAEPAAWPPSKPGDNNDVPNLR